uniref:Urocanase C-terminal domain-containing protein n=1 Tax=Ditylenchus dipsaci TaxID=166011 RepID=A0A915DCW9_9BILA
MRLGMLLDGSEEVDGRADMMLHWDVANEVSRRCWSGNDNALHTIKRTMELVPGLQVSLPNKVLTTTCLKGLFEKN